MAAINIIVADDVPDIHESLRETLDSLQFSYQIVGDFYDTGSLKRYLRSFTKEGNEGADVLILDYYFGGNSETGLDALPKIREYAPHLPIIFLTTFDDERFMTAAEQYPNVEYVNKPVKAYDLRFRIRDIVKRSEEWDSFQKQLQENTEMIQYLTEENEKERLAHPRISLEMQTLIQNIFPDIEFADTAFRYLLRKGTKKLTWNRIFRTLKIIDWKSERHAAAGVKVQKFSQGFEGRQNIWEYRFSDAGRIFVQRRPQEKPLLVLLDPFHEYSKRLR